jgi:hypothetical protein
LIKGRVDALPFVMYHVSMDKEKFIKWLESKIQELDNYVDTDYMKRSALTNILDSIMSGYFDTPNTIQTPSADKVDPPPAVGWWGRGEQLAWRIGWEEGHNAGWEGAYRKLHEH